MEGYRFEKLLICLPVVYLWARLYHLIKMIFFLFYLSPFHHTQWNIHRPQMISWICCSSIESNLLSSTQVTPACCLKHKSSFVSNNQYPFYGRVWDCCSKVRNYHIRLSITCFWQAACQSSQVSGEKGLVCLPSKIQAANVWPGC